MNRAQKIAQQVRNCCPTCGTKFTEIPLTINLDTNVIRCGTQGARVEPRLAELIWLLHSQYPHTVPRERVIAKVWPSLDIESKTIDTTICLARRYLEKMGWGIKAEYKIGVRLVKL